MAIRLESCLWTNTESLRSFGQELQLHGTMEKGQGSPCHPSQTGMESATIFPFSHQTITILPLQVILPTWRFSPTALHPPLSHNILVKKSPGEATILQGNEWVFPILLIVVVCFQMVTIILLPGTFATVTLWCPAPPIRRWSLFPFPLIWASLVSCFGQSNVVEVTACRFPA